LADIVVVHRRDACLAARQGGLGPAPKGLPDEPEIFVRVLEHRSDAAHRTRQPRDVLPRALLVPHQVRGDAEVRQAWVLMAQVLLRQVSQTPEMMPASRTEQFRASPRRVQRWPGGLLQGERPQAPPRAVPQQDVPLPELPPDLSVQFRASPRVPAWRLSRASLQS
jgi:hypothetical protein